MSRPGEPNNRSLPRGTVPTAGILLALIGGNWALSHGDWTLPQWFLIGWLGVFLPIGIWIQKRQREDPRAAIQGTEGVLGAPRAWWWAALPGAWGLGLRLYRLKDLGLWPTKDDGVYGVLALGQSMGKSNPFYVGYGEIAPLYLALQAWFFRLVEPSLLSLHLLPTILSLLVLPTAYAACRRAFPKSFSLLVAGVLAVGFWPAYIGRFSTVYSLILLWETVILGLLAEHWRNPENRWTVGVLGLGMGVGLWIYAPVWSVVLLAVTGVVLQGAFRGRRSQALSYALGLAVVAALPAWDWIRMGCGGHLGELFAGTRSSNPLAQALNAWGYVRGVFWGGDWGGMAYGPVWGGLLNPVTGSLWWLGIGSLYPWARRPAVQWALLLFALTWGLGFATFDLDFFRLVPMIPLLALGTAWGLVVVLESVPGKWRGAVAAVLILGAASLDAYHLAVAYPERSARQDHFFRDVKSQESMEAYRLLRAQADRGGPGDLFLDYVPMPLDQTLTVAAFPFNRLLNPRLRGVDATWAGWITNINEEPFLVKRFPEAAFHVLGTEVWNGDGEYLLVILPLSDARRRELEPWRQLQPAFAELLPGLVALRPGESRGPLVERFLESAPIADQDPFLASMFWEVAHFHHGALHEFGRADLDLAEILKRGYPSAQVFNELGVSQYHQGRFREARLDFERAVNLGGDHTAARENLALSDARLRAGGVNSRSRP